jgi:hypothetical protein
MNRVSLRMIVLLVAALPAAALAQTAVAVAPSQDVSLDPATAGIAAVNRASALLKGQGPEVAIAYFTDALNQARNGAVQRAIRFALCELYAESGRTDKALEVLKDQIAEIPPGSPPTMLQLVPADATGTAAAVPQQ